MPGRYDGRRQSTQSPPVVCVWIGYILGCTCSLEVAYDGSLSLVRSTRRKHVHALLVALAVGRGSTRIGMDDFIQTIFAGLVRAPWLSVVPTFYPLTICRSAEKECWDAPSQLGDYPMARGWASGPEE
ncbi:hypothetical protein BO78DRAFT_397276 [Aspergillus sclerotiicarbonarius CBS 121057]|uniref:Uncharacterized protein n=1 Tax=Aspergillus sclerotiicarbonarius (strain CBS 121057 / IBT 28362) TaxID=1448318 RepID=A0A319EEZ6_ASPSB|nr:hypothetical protein BO78DRAFT_397276 [Aspergillus sclerotiicarbonarius CBS 121057]